MGVKNNLTLHKGFALVPSFLYQDSVLCVLGSSAFSCSPLLKVEAEQLRAREASAYLPLRGVYFVKCGGKMSFLAISAH